jgi:hypothetical protein
MLSICLVKVKVAMYCTVTCVTQVYVTPHTEIDTHTRYCEHELDSISKGGVMYM